MLDHIEPKQARDMLLELAASCETEAVSIYNALGRVLAEDCCASFPVPPFRKSPFDGYALRSVDCPGMLRVVQTVAAGDAPDFVLRSGEAVRIFTGSPVPDIADAVVKQEDVCADGDCISIGRKLEPDTNVIHAGEDYKVGTVLARAGAVLDYAQLGVLASQGYGEVSVYKRPVVSVMSTGSELTEPGHERGTYKIYNSSAAAICAWLQEHSLEPRYVGIVPDDAERIEEAVSAALDDSDVVLTTGGASVGDFDFALDTAKAVGAESLFWKVNMKPGGAILASVKDDKLLLSLSGNPAAALMGLFVIALPYFNKLCGKAELESERIMLPLKKALPKTSSVKRLLRGHLELHKGKAFFCEHSGRGNGNLSSFENCDLIGIVPPCNETLSAGTMIEAIRIR